MGKPVGHGPVEQSLARCCGKKTGIVDSMMFVLSGYETIRRRRKCSVCGRSTYTVEMPEDLARDVLSDD